MGRNAKIRTRGSRNSRSIANSQISRKIDQSAPVQERKYRLPTSGNIEKAVSDPAKSIPLPVIKHSIEIMLKRMAREKRIKSEKSVAEIMNEIFPPAGGFDKTAFEKYFNQNDRTIIYNNVADAETKIKKEERAKFKRYVQWAIRILRVAQGMGKSLKRIFGAKTSEAKTIYRKAGDVLQNLISTDVKMDSGFNTDYNRDDSEVNLGGWAWYDGQQMHLAPGVVKVKDERETLITVMHEATHLADNSVDDNGIYYPPSTNKDSFAALDEDTKITTASVLEEWPRRWLDRSKYAHDFVFTPGVSTTGKPPTLEDKARKAASRFYTHVWDRAVDIASSLRNIRKYALAGDKTEFNNNKAEILIASSMLGLTIHQQKAKNPEVTQIDVVLAEGVARGAAILGGLIRKLSVMSIADASEIDKAKNQLIVDALKKYDALLGDHFQDIMAVFWLEHQYHNPSFYVG